MSLSIIQSEIKSSVALARIQRRLERLEQEIGESIRMIHDTGDGIFGGQVFMSPEQPKVNADIGDVWIKNGQPPAMFVWLSVDKVRKWVKFASGDESVRVSVLVDDDYSCQGSERLLCVNTEHDSVLVCLPEPSEFVAKEITVKQVSNENFVTVEPYNSELIDGSTNIPYLDSRNAAMTLISDGINWHIVSVYVE